MVCVKASPVRNLFESYYHKAGVNLKFMSKFGM